MEQRAGYKPAFWEPTCPVIKMVEEGNKNHDHDDHSGCNHDWKPYIGFTESYRYCTKCSEKRNLNDE